MTPIKKIAHSASAAPLPSSVTTMLTFFCQRHKSPGLWSVYYARKKFPRAFTQMLKIIEDSEESRFDCERSARPAPEIL